MFRYVESYGETGAAMFRLVSLGLQQRVAGASERVANLVWDRSYIDDTSASMDEDDYVETSMGINISASAGVSTRDGIEIATAAKAMVPEGV